MKKIKRLVAVFAVAVMVQSLTAVATAENVEEFVSEFNNSSSDDEGFVLISEQTIAVDDETTCVSRIYQKADEISTYSTGSTKGHMTVKAKNTFTYSGAHQSENWATIWVEGTFYWDSEKDTATVSGVTDGKSVNDGRFFEVLNDYPISYDSNQGNTSWFGKKYAYIEKKIKMTNGSSTKDLVLWLDVNVEGEIKAKPSTAEITVN